MPKKSKTRSSNWSLGKILAVVVGVFVLLVFALAREPDIELQFARDVPSELTPDRLDRNISSVSRWPQWFFALAEAQVVNPPDPSHPDQLASHTQLILNIDPKKWRGKKFALTANVVEYTPGKRLRLQIVDDSSKRLTKLFDSLEWQLEFYNNSEGGGSLVHATATARSKHWRSRLFGRIAEKILMNQTFYPDVVKLAMLRQPFSSLQDPMSPPPVVSE